MKFTRVVKSCLAISVVFLSSLWNTNHAQNWSETDKLVGSVAQLQSRYGQVVSINGEFAVVAAPSENHSGFSNAGAVYIYKKQSDDTWDFIQRLTANDAATQDSYGASIAISEIETGNGFILAVGAPNQDTDRFGNNHLTNSGAVYVYRQVEEDAWVFDQKLVPNAGDRQEGTRFGTSVAAYKDRVVVGAPIEDNDRPTGTIFGETSQTGAVYVYNRVNSPFVLLNWTQTQKLTPSLPNASTNRFGQSVACHEKWIFIGAFQDGTDVNGNNFITDAGAVYIFKHNNALIPWIEDQKIVAPVRSHLEKFGYSVDGNGSHLIVGTGTSGNPIKTAYVFNLTPFAWEFETELMADDAQAQDHFGFDVAITDDYALVGAYGEDEDENGLNTESAAGSAYLFKRQLVGGDFEWNQIQKLVASDRAANNFFGYGVDIYETHAIAGANGILNAGAAYTFELTAPTPFANGRAKSSLADAISSQEEQFTVYPNPSNGIVNIRSSQPIGAAVYSIKVYNYEGKVIKTVALESEIQQVDLEAFPAGLYYIELSNEAAIYRYKLVKS